MCLMGMTQTVLPVPNPYDWMDVEQAQAALGVSRATLYKMINDARVGDYRIGRNRVFWALEVHELATALRRVRAHGVHRA